MKRNPLFTLRTLRPLLLSLAAGALLPAATTAQTPVVPDVGPRTWAKPDHFWFRRSIPGGNVWLTVDAVHGVKEPLFDHQRLAIELSLRTGVEFAPLSLPFANPAMQFTVKYDGSNAYIQEGALAVEFLLDGYLWRCDLQIKWDWNRVPPTDYECLSRRRADAVQGSAREQAARRHISPDGSWEAFVRDHNLAIRRTAGDDRSTMLTSDGTADFAYDAGSIRWSADSRSLTAYRLHAEIWNATTVTANVKEHVVKGEWQVPASDRAGTVSSRGTAANDPAAGRVWMHGAPTHAPTRVNSSPPATGP